jgi:hypothetical protein
MEDFEIVFKLEKQDCHDFETKRWRISIKGLDTNSTSNTIPQIYEMAGYIFLDIAKVVTHDIKCLEEALTDNKRHNLNITHLKMDRSGSFRS